MGKKAKWFRAVKKVFSPESKKKKKEERLKNISEPEASNPASSLTFTTSREVVPPPPLPHPEDHNVVDTESEQSKEASSAATLATSAVTETLVTSAEASTQAIHIAGTTKFPGKASEEIAAIKIQTAFRGHLARRALRALRGLVRLKSLVEGNSVKRQATTTLRSMQTLSRVQAQIRSRRVRMLEENQALQRQMLLKHERELESLRMGEEWDDSLQSKEQIEASLLSKQEATVRRERAMAYSFTHQWKNSSKPANPMFMDPNNTQWGWSWLERWMAARPWENKSTSDRELSSDRTSAKGAVQSDAGGEILKAYAAHDTNADNMTPPASQKSHRPANRQSPSTPSMKAPWISGKTMKSVSPKRGWPPLEDDSSIPSAQSERPTRRHSLATASVRDDESLAGSTNFPSYMAPTESARAKSRFQNQNFSSENIDSSDQSLMVASAKKRLSFPVGERHNPPSPAARRRNSGPPKVDMASVKDVEVHS